MELNPALGINLKDFNANDILFGKLWRITEKIDGVRRLFYKDKREKVSTYSRTGKRDTWLPHITSYLEQKYFPSDMVYDCELVDRKLYFSNSDSFLLRTETTGKASQQFPDNKEDLAAICFDMFNPEGDVSTGEERHILLTKTFSRSSLNGPIFQVPCYGVLNGNDMITLSYLLKQVYAQNKEGLMLLNLDAPYISGRSKELLKVKRIEEFVGLVLDVEFGQKGTKIEGGISALICTVPGCTVPVRVGSGFTNEERKEFMNNSPIGKSIEIDAFSKTKDKAGNISLSMPIFKKLRNEME